MIYKKRAFNHSIWKNLGMNKYKADVTWCAKQKDNGELGIESQGTF